MATQGERMREKVVAGADLSSMQYRVIDIAGTLAEEADVAIGVLENKPEQGQHAEYSYLGKMKGIAGDAIAANARLTVNSGGFLVTVGSGDGTCCGKNLSGSVNSGDTFSFLGNFINANTLYDQQ